MPDFFAALKDNQHFVLLLLGGWAYFKWREKERQVAIELDAERKAHREATEEIIKASLSNGIGQRIKEILSEILREHERTEATALERAIGAFRAENTDAHKMIGQRQSDLEQRTAVMEDKWLSVMSPMTKRGAK